MTKEKRLSYGIQKFLETQKKEEQEKAAEAKRKLQEMLARRDPKEQRKIDKSLKVIKSSKKFYSGDRALDDNTALTMENEQPDEDDYGYTSQVSDQFHKKLMEKYQKLPEDKKFSSSNGHKAMSKEEIQHAKDRMKTALSSKDEEHEFKQGPKQRTSKLKSDKLKTLAIRSTTALSVDKKNFQKPKPKLKAAPIVDFQELLKLAEKKQHEEITIEVPTKKEPERLLTSKEKREQEELEAARKAKLKPNRIPRLGAIPRLGDSSKQDRNNNENAKKPATVTSAKIPEQKIPEKLKKPMPSNMKISSAGSSGSASSSSSSSKLRDALQTHKEPPRPQQKVPQPSKAGSSTIRPANVPSRGIANTSRPSTSKGFEKPRLKEPEKARDFPPKDLLRAREFPPKDLMRSREFPPKDLMRSREFPPKSREFPPRDMKRSRQQEMSRKRELTGKLMEVHFIII